MHKNKKGLIRPLLFLLSQLLLSQLLLSQVGSTQNRPLNTHNQLWVSVDGSFRAISFPGG
jgi:hypothetical protein